MVTLDDKELSVVDHLEELRKRLIITAIFFIVSFIVAFIFVKDIYKWFVADLDVKLIALGPSDVIWIYFTLSSVIAVAVTIPIAALQLWLFIKPALNEVERRISLSYIPLLFFLFIGGLSFGYFVIMPTVLSFLVELVEDMMITSFTAEKYFGFIFNMTIPFGILFELPVIVMFLTSIGIITPTYLRKIRKYAYFILVIVSATITPPDFISDILVVIPLLLLYEISISLSAFIFKRKMKKENRGIEIRNCSE